RSASGTASYGYGYGQGSATALRGSRGTAPGRPGRLGWSAPPVSRAGRAGRRRRGKRRAVPDANGRLQAPRADEVLVRIVATAVCQGGFRQPETTLVS